MPDRRCWQKYVDLLGELSRLAFIGVPPVQREGRLTQELATRFTQSIDAYNAMLPDVVRKNFFSFSHYFPQTGPPCPTASEAPNERRSFLTSARSGFGGRESKAS